MKRFVILIFLIGSFFSCVRNPKETQTISVIPKPLTVKQGKGSFNLSLSTPIVLTNKVDDMRASYTVFNRWLSRSLGKVLEVKEGQAQDNAINITFDDALSSEEYVLEVTKRGINILSGSPKAVSYALQTLRQLLPPSAEQVSSTAVKYYKIPETTIYDCPRYPYRGIKLNVARHFYPVDEIKTFIDMMAIYKLDLLHLRLSGNEGWRIEIHKYPKLMVVASRFPRSNAVAEDDEFRSGEGYYTQEQIRDIVKYAADRYITIVPEIEFPNHALAALAAYPELGCGNKTYQVTTTWENQDIPFCAGNEQVYEFLCDVFNEIVPLFSSRYFVINNIPFTADYWNECKKCSKYMEKENIGDVRELQQRFRQRVEQYIITKDKEIMTLNTNPHLNIDEQPDVMSINYQPTGGKIFMRDNINHMSNVIYNKIGLSEFADNIHEYSDIERLYNIEPTDGLTERESRYLIGVQGNMWTTTSVNDKRIQYMSLPGIAALAEIAWVPRGERNYNDFSQRTSIMSERYKALGYDYATIITEKK